jgi:hypothetical protein
MEKIETTIPSAIPPLRLSSQAIKDFQAAYFDEHHVHISDEEANRLGMKLLRLFRAIYRPIKSDLNIKTYGNK